MLAKLVDFGSFVKSDGYQPVLIRLAVAVIAGRYVCRLPMKVAIPVAMTVILTDWTIRWNGAEVPNSYRRLKQISIGIIVSVVFVGLSPQFLSRVWGVVGLWMLVFVTPTLVDKFRGLKNLEPSSLSSSTLLQLRKATARTFRDYFAKDDRCSLKVAKKNIFVKGISDPQLVIGNNRRDYLIAALEGDAKALSVRILYQQGGEGTRKEKQISSVETAAVLRTLIPTRQDIVLALEEAAANLTKQRAHRLVSLAKKQNLRGTTYILQTEDGRWWVITGKGNKFAVKQLAYIFNDEEKLHISNEVICAWSDFNEMKHSSHPSSFQINKTLYDKIQQAFGKFNHA